jgi:23S rRNA U2552 (ribose-2'-O)-methylase RlmE/FtsJ
MDDHAVKHRTNLRENNVEGIDIMQISGHKNVSFINNYSTLSEERHKKISNILSNTETNRNALIPVQFVNQNK